MMTVIAFDFAHKTSSVIDASDIAARRARGEFCWQHLSAEAFDEIGAHLLALGVDAATTQRIETNESVGDFHVGRASIALTLVEAHFDGGTFRLSPLHVVVGDGFMVTAHSAPSPTMTGILETYAEDFRTSAQTAGFLLFELADHIVATYRTALGSLAGEVELIQATLLGEADDSILSQVSALTRSLLDYRKAVVAAREIMHELATRRSPYVQPTTQPYLEKLTLPLERLAADAATERTVLSESLSLYMGIVGHRTNQVVTRLTIVSMIFLPLSFLAALYGMNFEHMPELKWEYGYLAFWVASITLVVGLVALMRVKRWI
jgi:magnesium transporter